MKKQTYLLYSALLTILIAAISCAKYLDKKPSNAITTPSTLSDLQALLDNANRVMNTNIGPVTGEASSDDYFLPANFFTSINEWGRHIYKRAPYELQYANDWSMAYTPIYNANYCLEMLQKIEKTKDNTVQWDNVYGSALFFRSFFFQQLAWIYAKAYDESSSEKDLGIVLRLTSDFNVPSKRATVTETYNQIINDTKLAGGYLSPLPDHPYRPSKAAVYGLLARTYLSMRLYDSAYRYAGLCLDIKSDLMDYNGDSDVGNLTANYPFKRFNKETIFYVEMTTGGAFPLILPLRAKVDTVLYDIYEANDLRRTAFFAVSGGYPNFKGSYAQSTSNFSGLATDEIWLIFAECLARRGYSGLEAATSNLNHLLKHRYNKDSFVSLAYNDIGDLLNRILSERRKELLFRGIRWSDIKRLNKEGQNIILTRVFEGNTYTLLPNANYYALPIPHTLVEDFGLEQNPI
ncbi:RagB/SusD family nutrient uptake outer membrane protein [Niabella aquatica]